MKNLISRRLKKGFAANIYSQGLNMAIQLASVPIFLSYLDLETYGTWLMYFSASQFFLMADIGVFAVVMNRVTMCAGRHEWPEASHEFSNGLFWFFLSAPFVLILSALSLFLAYTFGGLGAEGCWVIGLLIAYSLMFNFTGILDAVFRAYDCYARGVAILETIRAVEWLSVLLVLALTNSMLWIAVDLLVFRVVATTGVVAYLSRHFRELAWRSRVASQQEIRNLLKDGISWIMYRVGDMISLQGATVVIGTTLGGSAAATFNTFRTVTRLPLQVLNGAVNPYWPEFSKLYGAGNHVELDKLFDNAKRLTNRLIVFLYALLIVVSPWFISIWSRKMVDFDWSVFLVMTLTAAVLAAWYPYKVLMASTNRIGVLSVYALTIYGVMVGAAQIVGFEKLLHAVSIFLLAEILVAALNIYFSKRQS